MAAKTYGPYDGVVDQVHDGDTVYAKLDIGFDLTFYARIRVFGIDAPELSTVEGKVSRDVARTLLPIGSDVRVVSHNWDKYGGRIDGDIEFRMAGIFVDFATTMINSGQAKPWLGTGPKP